MLARGPARRQLTAGRGFITGQQEQVVLEMPPNHFVAAVQEHFYHRFGVFRHLLLVKHELRLHRFFQRYRFTDDHTCISGPPPCALGNTAEFSFLYSSSSPPFAGSGRRADPHPSFVGGGGDNVSVRNRVRVNACGNQAATCAMSTNRYAPILSAISRILPSQPRRVGGKPPIIIFGLCSLASFAISS